MKQEVFIINGSGGAGKDRFVSFVSEALGGYVMNFSSVDKVKSIAKIIGWGGGKTERDRKFLSDLKILCTEYSDMPFKSMIKKVCEFFDSDYQMLFLHIREPKEIERAKLAFGAKTILIKRDSVQQITSNIADGGVFNYQYDIIINNDGDLKDYREKASKFVEDFKVNDFKCIY